MRTSSLAILHALPLLCSGRASPAAITPASTDQLVLSHGSDELAIEEATGAGASRANDTLVTITLAPGQYLMGKESLSDRGRRFLGIPYAAPPVGDLRWRTPQPPTEWTGVRKALNFGASCMQNPESVCVVGYGGTPSEDCLFLNVYTPSPKNDTTAEGNSAASSGSSTTSSDLLPIMIFFHGGSWASGSGACPILHGGNLVNNTNASIVVTVNYRLNTLGFLGGDALRDPSDGGSTGNWGVQDQRASMKWVQKYAAAFGGDPSRITIFGESAGAGSVAFHLAAPRSYDQSAQESSTIPLFRASMMESGNLAAPWNSQNMSYAEKKLTAVAVNLGCLPEGNVDPVSDNATLACLRAASAEELYNARHVTDDALLDWSPVQDGVELTGSPANLLASGQFAHNVTVLLGTNADEGSEFIQLSYDATFQESADYLTNWLGPELGNAVVNEYPPDAYNGTEDGKKPGHGGYWSVARAVGDGFFTCPARRTVRTMANAYQTSSDSDSKNDKKNKNDGTTPGGPYLYFFNHTPAVLAVAEPLNPDAVDSMGVYHGSEVAFVFDIQPFELGEDEKLLGLQLGRYWSNLAANLDPNVGMPLSGGVPPSTLWPAYTESTDEAMVLRTPVASAMLPESGLKASHCDFWDANHIPIEAVFGKL